MGKLSMLVRPEHILMCTSALQLRMDMRSDRVNGCMQERRYDASRGMSLLVEDWVSRASALQRKGRAGSPSSVTKHDPLCLLMQCLILLHGPKHVLGAGSVLKL